MRNVFQHGRRGAHRFATVLQIPSPGTTENPSVVATTRCCPGPRCVHLKKMVFSGDALLAPCLSCVAGPRGGQTTSQTMHASQKGLKGYCGTTPLAVRSLHATFENVSTVDMTHVSCTTSTASDSNVPLGLRNIRVYRRHGYAAGQMSPLQAVFARLYRARVLREFVPTGTLRPAFLSRPVSSLTFCTSGQGFLGAHLYPMR